MSAGVDPDLERLLWLARAGDGPALGQLLELYRNYISLLARLQISQRLQRKVDASDVVQEVFLKAHRHFGQFRGQTEGELLSWLRQILLSHLVNTIRHYQGSRRRDVLLERDLAAELDRSSGNLDRALFSKQSSPSHQAARREQAVLLADALRRLPEDYREVIILRHLEGLAFTEVAERMGRSLDSVDKLWVRALGRLRCLLRAPINPKRQQGAS
jgi:RNA polymerase sigma-70 factor (ECF subfamily)